MAQHRIGTQKEWQAERDELLKEEKELTRRGDELARKRRELPWVPEGLPGRPVGPDAEGSRRERLEPLWVRRHDEYGG
jgi:predicted dithiol-disulfide oxidoreductase (DUF899 family)